MKPDICVIGGGIAGLSIAYELSAAASVLVLEREHDIAYHTTGRSVSLYTEVPFTGTALSLSRFSRPFFLDPPAGFSEVTLQHDIGCLYVANNDEVAELEAQARSSPNTQIINADDVVSRVPVIRTGADFTVCGLYEADAFKIDIAAVVGGYRKGITANGGIIRCNSEVISMTRHGGGWQVSLADGVTVPANIVVNASGAWGDQLACAAGVRPISLAPLRRNIILFDPPDGVDPCNWPAVGGIRGRFYFLPESGKLLGSAADEVASQPCDAQPEDIDVATAAFNIETNTTLEIDRITTKWAGLRTFAPDRQIVAGYADDNTAFFWFVGHGGFGIQTAPAAARAAAALVSRKRLPDQFEQLFTAESLGPGRLRQISRKIL